MLRSIALALALTGCTTYTATTVTIDHDSGGLLHLYEQSLQEINQRGQCVEFRGYAASAATLWLAADCVCVHPDATLAFHGATRYWGGISAEEGSRLMGLFYTPTLREWFYAGPAQQRLGLTSLTGRQLHEEHGYDYC